MNIMIVDAHEIVREGLSNLLQQSFCIDQQLCAGNGYEAVKAAEHFHADLVLMDFFMPGRPDGYTTLVELRSLLQNAKIVIYSMHTDSENRYKAYEAGADGFLSKQLKRNDLLQSLDKILANQKVFDTLMMEVVHENNQLDLPITKREKEVFILTVLGFSQKDIAEKLQITIKTVENHRKKIGERLKTHKRYEWVEMARKNNLF